MKKFFAPFIALILLSASLFAQNSITHSAITFKTKNLGIEVDGLIGGLAATVHFNAKDLSSASFEATVEVKTINTDNSLRDEHLKSDEFFDMVHYPTISLKSIAITHKSGNKFVGQFNLTIKNKTKTVEIPFTCTAKGANSEFMGSFKINRLDFGIGGSSMTLSDDVTVSIDTEIGD